MPRRLAVTALALVLLPALGFAAAQMTDASKAYMEAHDRMMSGMMQGMTGNADRDFVLMMIPHHEGAVDMAKVELQYGTDPQLRALAEKIIAAQGPEIAEMKAWLEKNP
jgi:uncharacterized protein (DUF305 family)